MNWEPMSISMVPAERCLDPHCIVRPKVSHDLSDLDLLAKHWPLIFGKALDPSGVTGVQGLVLSRSGRLDSVDAKSPEIQRALRALDRLYDLFQEEKTRQAAQVLLYARVVCGEAARLGAPMFLEIGLAYRTAPKRMTAGKRTALVSVGKRLYDVACVSYRKAVR